MRNSFTQNEKKKNRKIFYQKVTYAIWWQTYAFDFAVAPLLKLSQLHLEHLYDGLVPLYGGLHLLIFLVMLPLPFFLFSFLFLYLGFQVFLCSISNWFSLNYLWIQYETKLGQLQWETMQFWWHNSSLLWSP